jgi:hypothetical protein
LICSAPGANANIGVAHPDTTPAIATAPIAPEIHFIAPLLEVISDYGLYYNAAHHRRQTAAVQSFVSFK